MGMKPINEIIDNEISFKKSSMTMKSMKRNLCSDAEAEAGAERYIRLLKAPECRQFFLKVMYHLPYDTRERCYEMATRPKVASAKKYFTHAARQELQKLGY